LANAEAVKTDLAAARMSSLEIGLRFCGIVEDAPRPGTKGSETSPSLVAIISMTSVASRRASW
jgi:hypothetical protein